MFVPLIPENSNVFFFVFTKLQFIAEVGRTQAGLTTHVHGRSRKFKIFCLQVSLDQVALSLRRKEMGNSCARLGQMDWDFCDLKHNWEITPVGARRRWGAWRCGEGPTQNHRDSEGKVSMVNAKRKDYLLSLGSTAQSKLRDAQEKTNPHLSWTCLQGKNDPSWTRHEWLTHLATGKIAPSNLGISGGALVEELRLKTNIFRRWRWDQVSWWKLNTDADCPQSDKCRICVSFSLSRLFFSFDWVSHVQ